MKVFLFSNKFIFIYGISLLSFT